MSAVLGLIEIAPSDQFEVPPPIVSDIGTLGAPVRELPTAVTSVLPLPAVFAFHCDTCGPFTVAVRLPPIASVSRIIPLITLGTSWDALVPAAPSAEVNVPRGTVWSTPVNVVAPATTPSVFPVGILRVTAIGTLVPEAGFSRYHCSTRRVFPASL